jgi:hypothetical protein
MAHECPECGQMCYCGGDIDDCCYNFDNHVINCTHYQQCQEIGDDNYDPDDDLDYDNEGGQKPPARNDLGLNPR